MARSLQDVYESARVNVPGQGSPDRGAIPAWGQLDEQVRYELEILKNTIQSVIDDESRLLRSHQRVIGQLNKGLRAGFFDSSQAPPDDDTRGITIQQPFEWACGWGVGRGPTTTR